MDEIQAYLFLAIISFLILFPGLILKKMQSWLMTEPLIAMSAGIITGFVLPAFAGENFPGDANLLMLTACKFTIAMALMATALRLPRNFILNSARAASIIVIAGIIGMWLISSTLAGLLFEIPLAAALIIGAVITPTDPVISASIVSGHYAKKYLPQRLRNLISFESGANDGLVMPFLMLPVIFMKGENGTFSHWLLEIVLKENLLAVIIGLGLGWTAGTGLHLGHTRWKHMTSKSLLPFSLALAFFVLAVLELLHMNSILGVFAAGIMLNRAISRDEDLQQERVQESMERIFTIPVFFFFGAMMPFQAWAEMGWALLIFTVTVLLCRRLPVILLIYPLIPSLRNKADAFTAGWIGPVGVAALYYTFYLSDYMNQPRVWVTCSAVVFGSTILHGITSVPVARLYHRWTGYQKNQEDAR